MKLQRTLRGPVTIKGIGLHTGKDVQVILKPGLPNQGVVFVRSDLPGQPEIPAHYKNVVETQLATTIAVGNASVSTVEHLLAALQGLEIDNVICEVDGPEVPILDGSSKVFCEEIRKVGLENQLQSRRYVALKRRIEVRIGEKWAVAEPSDCLEIQTSVEFDHPVIGYQELSYTEGVNEFSEIEKARTFCMLKDVEKMRQLGLIKGGSLDSAIVLDHSKVVNPEGLRYSDEIVRHKVLDSLGDLKLAGYSIMAQFRFHRSGHDLHNQLLSEIFKNPANYEVIEAVGSGLEQSTPAAASPVAVPSY